MKIFHTRLEAEKYADKNYFRGTYIIKETRNGNWKILKDIENYCSRGDFNESDKSGDTGSAFV